MTIKQEVIELIQRMPDDADIDDIMYELYFRQKVDASLQRLDNGEGVPHDEVKKRFRRWLK